MMSDSELICQIDGHNQGQISGFCVNKQCPSQKAVCFNCLREKNHMSHLNDVLNISEFQAKKLQANQVLKKIQQIIEEMETMFTFAKEFVKSNSAKLNYEMRNYTTQDYVAFVNYVIQLTDFDQFITKDLELLRQKTLSTKNKFNLFKQFNNNLEPQSLSINNNLSIQKDCSKYKFSQIYKHEQILITNDGFQAEGNHFCICEPRGISNQGLTRLKFKILELGQICIGICKFEAIKKAQFKLDYLFTIRNNYFLLKSDGKEPFSGESFVTKQKKSFSFGKKDVVIVEINPHNIIFIKKGFFQDKIFSRFFLDDCNDYVFCAYLNQAKIEIIYD